MTQLNNLGHNRAASRLSDRQIGAAGKRAQTDASLAAQSAYLLSVMGKWVANPSATVA